MTTREKPKKPREDFPLFPHSRGQWAKKIDGKMVYFGRWEDPAGAEAKYNRVRDGLPTDDTAMFTVKGMCDAFIDSRAIKRGNGELSDGMFSEYYTTGKRLCDHFGKARRVENIQPHEFKNLRDTLAKTFGPVGLGNEIVRVRSFFHYVAKNGYISKPMAFGTDFAKPSKRVLRLNRANREKRFLQAGEILALMKAARPQLKAMILLAVNTGAGNTDIAELRLNHLDLDKGMMHYPRPKTGIERRAPLWKETVEALRTVIASRPGPSEARYADRVFLTIYGNPWRRAECDVLEKGKMHFSKTDSIALEFGKLMRSVKVQRAGEMATLKRAGVGFYALRHVFETIAGETKDQVGVDRVMGHVTEGVASEYREWHGDEREDKRLRRIVDHVHKWLYAKPKKGKKTA